VIAETKISALPAIIDAGAGVVAGIIEGEAEEKVQLIKTEVGKVKDALKDAHAALVDVITEIKNSAPKSDKATTTPAQ
jgi:hypothetical protein